MNFFRGLLGGLLLLCANSACAKETSDAALAYDQGHYHEALAILTPLAADGDHQAQALLGLMYAQGNGVPRNDTKAAALFGQAAIEGNPYAESYLGKMYFKGRIQHRPNVVVGYALLKTSGISVLPDSKTTLANGELNAERSIMTVAQVSQGRTLADEIRRVGLLVALRGYLGEEKADDVLCSPLATKNACEGDRDVTGVPPLRLTIDEAGAIRQSGSEMSFPQLRALLLVSGARIPQSKIILTVNSDGPVANEAVAMVIAQVEKCGDSFISVLRGHTAGGIAKATDYHFSVVPAEVEPTSQAQHQPIFPADAEQVRHEGNPVVLVSLDDQGHIRFARIYRSSGYPELDASAVDAAKQWTYDPCLKNGVGFACAVHIPVNFLLTQQPIVSGS